MEEHGVDCTWKARDERTTTTTTRDLTIVIDETTRNKSRESDGGEEMKREMEGRKGK